MMDRETLDNLFASIRRNLDPHSPLLWGYFFMHSSKAPLEKAGQLLANQGYRLVNIYIGGEGDESPENPDQRVVWVLHIEKVEAHTVDTLHALNGTFYQFALDNGLDSYDGMDVGPQKMSLGLILKVLWNRAMSMVNSKMPKGPTHHSS